MRRGGKVRRGEEERKEERKAWQRKVGRGRSKGSGKG